MNILIFGLVNSIILALIACGFALVYGVSRLANFAHGALYILVGFATFASWYVLLWRTSRFLEANKQKIMSMFGLAGQLVLVAFLAEGFSIDTFALPYFWLAMCFINAGRSTASRGPTRISQPGNSSSTSPESTAT